MSCTNLEIFGTTRSENLNQVGIYSCSVVALKYPAQLKGILQPQSAARPMNRIYSFVRDTFLHFQWGKIVHFIAGSSALLIIIDRTRF